MKAKQKIVVVAGARPNFMKVGPLFWELARLRAAGADNLPEMMLIHTGQHYSDNMSEAFFRDLGIPEPDENLEVGSDSHARQTAAIMVGFERVWLRERPDWVVVVGDVNSTAACALTVSKLGGRLAHVEAGLRSRDRSMPEEINRLVTDVLADRLYTTDVLADQNLLAEGVDQAKIRLVGNIMIDSLARGLPKARSLAVAAELGLAPGAYAVVTLHRPSNVDAEPSLRAMWLMLGELQRRLPVVFPVHPRTMARLADFGLLGLAKGWPGLRLVEPMGYLRFLGLVADSRLVLTDSGGLQEETCYLGLPCLTLRQNTERPVTIAAGTNHLVGLEPADILAKVDQLLAATKPAPNPPPLWDGHTARRIMADLLAG
ncbi:UDP-N-acetylglucosamine 2-epimerase [Desulfarculus baarsii DSM 2075]|uniref:UDP-N-acetylglucosamine 2-epimerase n=1 Tax=Desulfarculus baarsii (strain ATCC 33931 / DSM 2075 / LMG 7858 / VKM B-1802 / 2st14) TaxID=644282 RepID=E1QM85_DESB2|nr:UDP-N-acetylglucosamine 2-epimerase (non-hydrolyzing) [Desulfarculus baarsii]ADK86128.1 UDP-N-acetylglucosamine 2-epimerase [Desulfarculus baarsii DSM 2075]